MTAVLDKPRAKAKPKATKSDLQLRMSPINTALDDGHRKLHLAQQSAIATDVGEPVEVLLSFVTEILLPEAIAPLQQTPLTREVVDAVYTGMFPTLAALQGVIALARGSVVEATVREAHDLLDAANSAMEFADTGSALPDKLVAAAQAPAPVRRAAHSDERQDPYVAILHALTCVEAASVNGGTDVLCALHSLTEKASEKVSEANGQLQAGSYSQELHDAASDELAGLLGLLRVLDDGTEPMLSAAETLVILCKAGIDRAIHKQPKAGLHT